MAGSVPISDLRNWRNVSLEILSRVIQTIQTWCKDGLPQSTTGPCSLDCVGSCNDEELRKLKIRLETIRYLNLPRDIIDGQESITAGIEDEVNLGLLIYLQAASWSSFPQLTSAMSLALSKLENQDDGNENLLPVVFRLLSTHPGISIRQILHHMRRLDSVDRQALSETSIEALLRDYSGTIFAAIDNFKATDISEDANNYTTNGNRTRYYVRRSAIVDLDQLAEVLAPCCLRAHGNCGVAVSEAEKNLGVPIWPLLYGCFTKEQLVSSCITQYCHKDERRNLTFSRWKETIIRGRINRNLPSEVAMQMWWVLRWEIRCPEIALAYDKKTADKVEAVCSWLADSLSAVEKDVQTLWRLSWISETSMCVSKRKDETSADPFVIMDIHSVINRYRMQFPEDLEMGNACLSMFSNLIIDDHYIIKTNKEENFEDPPSLMDSLPITGLIIRDPWTERDALLCAWRMRMLISILEVCGFSITVLELPDLYQRAFHRNIPDEILESLDVFTILGMERELEKVHEDVMRVMETSDDLQSCQDDSSSTEILQQILIEYPLNVPMMSKIEDSEIEIIKELIEGLKTEKYHSIAVSSDLAESCSWIAIHAECNDSHLESNFTDSSVRKCLVTLSGGLENLILELLQPQEQKETEFENDEDFGKKLTQDKEIVPQKDVDCQTDIATESNPIINLGPPTSQPVQRLMRTYVTRWFGARRWKSRLRNVWEWISMLSPDNNGWCFPSAQMVRDVLHQPATFSLSTPQDGSQDKVQNKKDIIISVPIYRVRQIRSARGSSLSRTASGRLLKAASLTLSTVPTQEFSLNFGSDISSELDEEESQTDEEC